MSKVISLQDAVALVPDGASIGTGGVLLTRKPVALLDAIGRARRDLTLWTMLGSIDAELLAAHGALKRSNAIYVGFEQLGFAPAYGAAIASGEIEARDWSEFLFMGGLRASIAGLPFLPTRGGRGSDVIAELGLEHRHVPVYRRGAGGRAGDPARRRARARRGRRRARQHPAARPAATSCSTTTRTSRARPRG